LHGDILSGSPRCANDHSAADVRFNLQHHLHVGSLHLILSAVVIPLHVTGVRSAGSGRFSLVLMALVLPFLMALAAEQARPAIPLIFDTDMESDVDDVGALAMLHALADQGETVILGVMVSAKNPHSAACADRINSYYGRPDLPIGVLKGPGVDRASRYADHVAREFPGALSSSHDAPDATDLYREILAGQPEKSVVLLTVGYKTNLRNLLHSGPCRHSNLTGEALVNQKVRLWVCMGGQFPEGREANIRWDAAAAAEAIENWPTEIIFSGWEIGRPIMTGGQLGQLPGTSPVRRSYDLFNGLKPHHSWDQAATLFAVRSLDEGPASEYWKLSPPGRIVINPDDGSNTWEEKPDGSHRYKRMNRDPAMIAEELDALMMHLPIPRP
jgi:purine nucleosidase